MSIKLRRANMVILGWQHNPEIVSPSWLKEKGLITEEPTQFAHTKEFSAFESETLSLILDRERLQISAKKRTPEALQAVQHVGAGYIAEQPQIAYRALGYNFEWVLEVAPGEALPQVAVQAGRAADPSALLPGHQLNFGFVVVAEKNPYRLRLVAEPEGNSTMAYKFNYHHELGGVDLRGISQIAATLVGLSEHSRTIAESLSTTGGNGND